MAASDCDTNIQQYQMIHIVCCARTDEFKPYVEQRFQECALSRQELRAGVLKVRALLGAVRAQQTMCII